MKKSLKLHTEIFGQGESLTMIHGWGAQNAVWREWAQTYLADHFLVTLVELPGFGESPKLDLNKDDDVNQAWLSVLADAIPSQTHLLGWSLGGLMAQQLALHYPQKVNKLVCLASTPRFTQSDHWTRAISPELMADFIKALGLDSFALLSRFWKLQLQGSDGGRQLIKHFVNQMHGRTLPAFSSLLQGLELLRDIDLRDAISQIQAPTLWLLGEKDPLVPLEMAQTLLKIQPTARLEVINGAAHVPFFSHPEQTASKLIDFLKTENHG